MWAIICTKYKKGAHRPARNGASSANKFSITYLIPRHTGRETVTERDFPVFKSEWNYPRNEYLEVLYAQESTSYPVIVILSSFSWGTNLFDSEITKIASRYGFASGVSRP